MTMPSTSSVPGRPSIRAPLSATALGGRPALPTGQVAEIELHSERERYRATIQLRTPDGELSTLIVLPRGSGRDGRVQLTFDGAIKITVTMDNLEADEVASMVETARLA